MNNKAVEKYIYHTVMILLLAVTIFFITPVICDAESVDGENTTTYTSEMEYDVESGYYIQKVVTTSTYYDELTGFNVKSVETVTNYYSFDGISYILQNTTKSTSYEYFYVTPGPETSPMPTAEPAINTPAPLPTFTPEYDFSLDKEIDFDTDPIKFSVKRNSNTKVEVKWKINNNADGYYIFRAVSENGKYSKVKTIKDKSIIKYVDKKLKPGKLYYYKVQAYMCTEEGNITSDMSEAKQVSTYKTQQIVNKLKKLKKIYPDGKYWNHVGYRLSAGQSTYGYVTDKPCNHVGTANGVASTCNSYTVNVNGVMTKGYQCYGFASLIGDKLFGKSKIRTHHSYKKAKVGDHVRYGGHSVVIIEKHTNYIKVAECNIGNTCIIRWGRKIAKSVLGRATYYTR